MPSDYRPRLSAELTQEQHLTLQKILPHGMQKPLFQVLVNGIIAIHKAGGIQALGAIVSEYISIHQVVDIGLNYSRDSQIRTLEAKLEELRNGNN